MKACLGIILIQVVFLLGCASGSLDSEGSDLLQERGIKTAGEQEKFRVEKGLRLNGSSSAKILESKAIANSLDSMSVATSLEPMRDSREQFSSTGWRAPLNGGAWEKSIGTKISAAELSILEVLEYIATEILGANIYIDEGVNIIDTRFTGTMLENTQVKDVVKVIEESLRRSGISLRYSDYGFFLTTFDDGGFVPIGIGSSEADVPQAADRVIQVIPVLHSFYMEIDALVAEVAKVSLRRSIALNAYIADGPRDQVLRVMQLVSLFDRPLARGRYITIRKAQHMTAERAAQEVRRLLSAEGVLSDQLNSPLGDVSARQLIFLPVNSLNSVVIFSGSQELIDRSIYWFALIDQPRELNLGVEFFTYVPAAAKPEDILQTLTKMFSADSQSGPSNSRGEDSESPSVSSGQAPASNRSASISPSSKIVLDENLGALLILGTQAEYEAIFPILKMLDAEPKQIFLDVLIAEVSMTGDLRYGLEWALSNRGIKYNTLGGFNAGSIGGFSVSLSKDKVLDGRLFGSDNEINVLSSPSLVVREGMDATIRIGSKISVVGETTFDPLAGSVRQTQSASYLDTGVQVTIRPELSGNNVVELNIDQNISNAVPGSSGAAGNPDIFERAVKTSVLAADGQSVLLAGLISERENKGSQGLPLLSRAPIVGGLFGSQQKQTERTELIILVTPKILSSVSDWSSALEEMKARLRFEPLELFSD